MASGVLITGGAGFIGSNLIERLRSCGERVIVYDNFSTGKKENLSDFSGVKVVEGDVSENFYEDLCQIYKETPFSSIVHLAAQVSVQKSLEDPVLDAKQNYLPMYDILKFLKENKKVNSLVFASSAAVYGDVTEFPVKESAHCVPLSPYGTHKLMCEKLMENLKGVNATALRFFNVYGPKQDPSSPYSGVISIFMNRVLGGEKLKVYGKGDQTRDFIYVSNVIDVIQAALSKKTGSFDVFNVGNSRELSILNLAELVCDQEGMSRDKIEFAPPRDGDIFRSVSCIESLKGFCGFKEVLMKEGIFKTISWFKS